MKDSQPWQSAIVTGASAGIGAACARHLAARGVRYILLVARRADRLAALAQEISRSGAVHAEPLACDLTRRTDIEALAHRIEREPPDLLIANAGAGRYGPFDRVALEPQLECIDLNVRSLVHLSWAYVRAARQRDRGALLLVASTAGFVPMPFEAVYGATKSFVIQFGSALAEELRGSSVQVRVLCPGFTETEFAAVAGLPDSVVLQNGVQAKDVAATGLASFERSGVIAVHGRRTRVAAWLGRIAPQALVARGIGRWMRRGLTPPGTT